MAITRRCVVRSRPTKPSVRCRAFPATSPRSLWLDVGLFYDARVAVVLLLDVRAESLAADADRAVALGRELALHGGRGQGILEHRDVLGDRILRRFRRHHQAE